MTAFDELTYLGQLRALRPLADEAAVRFGLSEARLTLIQHGENATYRVDSPEPVLDAASDTTYKQGRYLLRIHRADYQTDASIVSELAWLAALRHDAELAVLAPVPSAVGEFLVRVSTPAIADGRSCSLLRWLRGRFSRRRREPSHFGSLRKLMAHLHQHAMHWARPPTFMRRHWDWDGLFGDGAGYHLNNEDVWRWRHALSAGSFGRQPMRFGRLCRPWGPMAMSTA